MKIFRKLIPILVIIGLLLCANPVYAISNTPETLLINYVDIYNDALALNDMIVIIDFTCEYGTTPTESITNYYVVKFLDPTGTTEYGSVSPVAYFNYGYTRGVVGLYFSADDVTDLGITWGSDCIVRIVGLPFADWDSTPIPESADFSDITWTTSDSVAVARGLISTLILDKAYILQTYWADEDYVLYQSAATGGFQLSADGNTYFSYAIPYLSLIAPNILPSYSAEMTPIDREYNMSWQATIDSYVADTIFDLSDVAEQYDLSARMVTSVLWIAAMIFFIIVLARKAGSMKPAILFSFPLIVCGTLISWLPVQGALFLGFIMGVMTWYVFTYEKTS